MAKKSKKIQVTETPQTADIPEPQVVEAPKIAKTPKSQVAETPKKPLRFEFKSNFIRR